MVLRSANSGLAHEVMVRFTLLQKNLEGLHVQMSALDFIYAATL